MPPPAPSPTLLRRLALRFVAAFVVLPAVIVAPAGTWGWPEAWIWFGILLASTLGLVGWIYRRDPAVLERRLALREPETRQRWIVAVSGLAGIATFVLPGLDRRFGWSEVPWALVLAGDAVLVGAFLLFAVVLRTNAWAGRTVRVEAGQRVIDVGPYAWVRHPMYVSSLLVFFATPVALGSWWGLVPALLTLPSFVARILAEEDTLLRELPGYADYRKKVPWRLIPWIW